MAKKPETVFKDRIRPHLNALPNSWFVKVQQRGIRGTPDLLGCVNGLFVALELKESHRARIDALQIYTLEMIRKCGGNALVVCPENWEEVHELLKILAQRSVPAKYMQPS